MNIEHTAHATLSHSAPRAQNKNRRSIIDVWVYRHARGTRLARSSHDRHVRVRSTRPAHIAESSQHMPHCTLGSPARSPDPTARTRAFLAIAMTHLRAQLCRASRPPTTHVASPAHHAARRGIPSPSHAPPSCTSRDRAWVRRRGRQDAPPPPLPPHTPIRFRGC